MPLENPYHYNSMEEEPAPRRAQAGPNLGLREVGVRAYKATVWSAALLGGLVGLPMGLVALFTAVFAWGVAAVSGAFTFTICLALVRARPTKRKVVIASAIAGGLTGVLFGGIISWVVLVSVPVGATAAGLSAIKNSGGFPEVYD